MVTVKYDLSTHPDSATGSGARCPYAAAVARHFRGSGAVPTDRKLQQLLARALFCYERYSALSRRRRPGGGSVSSRRAPPSAHCRGPALLRVIEAAGTVT